MKVARMDPRGAYILLSHLTVPACGGYTDRIEVRSQRQSDIPAAFHRWLATNKPLATQCVILFVYGDHRTYDREETLLDKAGANGAEAGAALSALPPTGYYQNSPGKDEVWVAPDRAGTQQVFWKATASNSGTGSNWCGRASDQESLSVKEYDSDLYRSAYDDALKGLADNERCNDDTASLVNRAYLTSIKALSEHFLSEGDSRTDLNEANMLLEQCVTHRGLYGTGIAAQCETQQENNIRAKTNWEMGD
jgi:hypothetical protein